MSEPIERKRRRRTDSSEVDLSLISLTETEAGSSTKPTDTESKNEHPPSNTPQAGVVSLTTHQMTIDRILKEINEDQYHSQLNEPDYSNDTHDWSNEPELFSSDYWHFLGRFK